SMALIRGGNVAIFEGDSLQLLGAPQRKFGADFLMLAPAEFGRILTAGESAELLLRVLDRDGREGTLDVDAIAIELVAAEKDDEEVHEIAFVDKLQDSVTQDRDRTSLLLAASLKHCYDRDTASVNANVAPATHGETVGEILGSGDA